jgi:environmental stress-induced protein Ves
MVQILKHNHYKNMPWKSGMGMTSQIAIFPEEADFTKDSYLWRLSSARVTTNSRFSNFSGYDRLIVVIRGGGLLLNKQKILPFVPHFFRGEEKIICEPIAGAVTDLGVIYNREKVRVDARILSNFNNETKVNLNILSKTYSGQSALGTSDSMVGTSDSLNFLFCAQGSIVVNGIMAEEHDSFKIQDESNIDLKANKDAIGILISIQERK